MEFSSTIIFQACHAGKGKGQDLNTWPSGIELKLYRLLSARWPFGSFSGSIPTRQRYELAWKSWSIGRFVGLLGSFVRCHPPNYPLSHEQMMRMATHSSNKYICFSFSKIDFCPFYYYFDFRLIEKSKAWMVFVYITMGGKPESPLNLSKLTFMSTITLEKLAQASHKIHFSLTP